MEPQLIVPVVFAEEGSEPLLGAVTLEMFLLGVDPVRQRLVPVRALLMANRSGDRFSGERHYATVSTAESIWIAAIRRSKGHYPPLVNSGKWLVLSTPKR